MTQHRKQPNVLLQCLTTALVGAVAFTAAAQDQNGGQDAGEQPNGDERSTQWEIPDDATSENNRMLQRILQRYPDADTDKDGKLDAAEARELIKKQRERWRDRGNWQRDRLKPTFDDVKYGPNDKHHFDLYQADTENPAPLVVFFHGGQFITGNEASTRPFDIQALLDAGISVASIDYRETNEAPFPGPFEDAEKAVRFIRFYAEQLHIDRTRIAGLGDEAGGNLALYLALQEDLFDQEMRDKLRDGAIEDPREALPDGPIRLPDAESKESAVADVPEEKPALSDADDPEPGQELEQEEKEVEEKVDSLDDLVLEERIPWDAEAIRSASTKLQGAVALHPIATFDPRAWKTHGLPMNDHERLMTKYLDVRYLEPLNDPTVIELVERVSPLSLVSAGDPPVLLLSQYEDLSLPDNTVWTIMRHHPMQSKLIASAMRAKGNQATVRYKGMSDDPGTRTTDFLINLLK